MDKSVIQAIASALISFGVGSTVYFLARKQKINFRYTVGWLILCLIGIVGGLGAFILEPIARFMGVTPSAIIGLLALLLLVLISIQLSVSISGLQMQNRKLAEQLALIDRIGPVRPLNTSDNQVLDQSNVLVIIPAFNEERNLAAVLNEVIAAKYKILVVNDGSRDQTRKVAIDSGVDVLTLPFNLGVGGALRAGFNRACELEFSAVIQFDADGQHQSQEIINLLQEANSSGAHLVVGSRFKSTSNQLEIGTARRLVMRMLARSASAATSTEITDPTSGFRLIRQPLLHQFSLNFPVNYLGDTYEAMVSAGRAGYTVREVPAAMRNRVYGVSSASRIQAIKFILKSILVAFVRLHIRIPQYVPGDSLKSQ